VPAKALFQKEGMGLTMEEGNLGAVLFQGVEVLEEENPGPR